MAEQDYQRVQQEMESFWKRGMHRGLDRMREAIELLDRPEKGIPFIHIAGTNGKGSTSAMTVSILREAGYRVGFTLSPHILDFRERIQCDGQWISCDEVVSIHDYLKEKLGELKLTYFEWVILMALEFFKRRKVDVAILEVGMGGRWDATNVVQPLVGAITNISLDHQQFLGSTLEDILREKMGIIKEGMKMISGLEDLALRKLLMEFCQVKNIPLVFSSDLIEAEGLDTFSILGYHHLHPALAGEHQKKNAAVAVCLVQALKEEGWEVNERAIREGLKKVFWPGRLEKIEGNPPVLLDGAHNRGGIEALVLYLSAHPGPYHLVFGCLKDRPYEELMNLLLPHVVSATMAFFEADRAFKREELQEKAETLSKKWGKQIKVMAISAWGSYVENLNPTGSVLVTGSLYLISQVRQFLKNERKLL